MATSHAACFTRTTQRIKIFGVKMLAPFNRRVIEPTTFSEDWEDGCVENDVLVPLEHSV